MDELTTNDAKKKQTQEQFYKFRSECSEWDCPSAR